MHRQIGPLRLLVAREQLLFLLWLAGFGPGRRDTVLCFEAKGSECAAGHPSRPVTSKKELLTQYQQALESKFNSNLTPITPRFNWNLTPITPITLESDPNYITDKPQRRTIL
jgi:hypothetical protein